jgi:hypothetical protein
MLDSISIAQPAPAAAFRLVGSFRRGASCKWWDSAMSHPPGRPHLRTHTLVEAENPVPPSTPCRYDHTLVEAENPVPPSTPCRGTTTPSWRPKTRYRPPLPAEVQPHPRGSRKPGTALHSLAEVQPHPRGGRKPGTAPSTPCRYNHTLVEAENPVPPSTPCRGTPQSNNQQKTGIIVVANRKNA